MSELSLAGAVGVAALLGLRHGLEADHLATIDGLSRAQGAGRKSGPAGLAGLAFALGHAAVLLVVCCALAALGQHLQAPAWLATLGRAVPVLALLALAAFNLAGRRHRQPLPVGGLGTACGLGALFALSMDAFLTASWLAGMALSLGPAPVAGAAMLAGMFGLGMAVTDGATGWYSARLLAVGGRLPALMVAAGCLLSAALIGLEPWLAGADGFGPALSWGWSAGLLLLAPLAWAGSRRLSARPASPAPKRQR